MTRRQQPASPVTEQLSAANLSTQSRTDVIYRQEEHLDAFYSIHVRNSDEAFLFSPMKATVLGRRWKTLRKWLEKLLADGGISVPQHADKAALEPPRGGEATS